MSPSNYRVPLPYLLMSRSNYSVPLPKLTDEPRPQQLNRGGDTGMYMPMSRWLKARPPYLLMSHSNQSVPVPQFTDELRS